MVENDKFYTENDIMKVIMQMTEENRIALLSIGFEGLISIANNTESAQIALENCDKYIAGWQRTKEAIAEFVEKKNGQMTGHVLDEMANAYKELSREEQLEFCKRISGESTIENKLDMLNYSCKNLIDALQKVVNV